jgi:hypothetical protein
MTNSSTPARPRRQRSPLREAVSTGLTIGVVMTVIALFIEGEGSSVAEKVGLAAIYIGGSVVAMVAFRVIKVLLPNDGRVFGVAALAVFFVSYNWGDEWADWLIYANPGVIVLAVIIDNLYVEDREIRRRREAAAQQAGRTTPRS